MVSADIFVNFSMVKTFFNGKRIGEGIMEYTNYEIIDCNRIN